MCDSVCELLMLVSFLAFTAFVVWVRERGE